MKNTNSYTRLMSAINKSERILVALQKRVDQLRLKEELQRQYDEKLKLIADLEEISSQFETQMKQNLERINKMRKI